MTESPVNLLRVHARQAPWNARGLAAHATALVDSAGLKPTNASARSALTARAVRFYVANGLLDRPQGKGTAATYGYRHLLHLLAIKIRQREGQTLEVIKQELVAQTGDAIERRVAQSLAAALSLHAPDPLPDDDAPAHTWRHVSIASGVELHVRDDVRGAGDEIIHAVRTAVRGIMVRGET